MALTPEDVVNKRFQHVKFREGYDQDEVDDFLDEVVVELRRLYTENDDLRQKLSAAEAKVEELQSKKAPASAPAEAPKAEKKAEAAPATAPQAPAKTETSAPVEADKADKAKEEAAAKEAPEAKEAPKAPAAPAVSAGVAGAAVGASAAAPAAQGGDQDAHGLIALAQRVHDEHVAEGERTRDKLIGEAEKKSAEILSAAEKKRDETLSQLENQKASLEREIDGLQNFERQYRTRLKSYLSDQLRDLESSGTLAPETLSGSKVGGNSNSL